MPEPRYKISEPENINGRVQYRIFDTKTGFKSDARSNIPTVQVWVRDCNNGRYEFHDLHWIKPDGSTARIGRTRA